jgi:GNAT superfamily N-acetyltransferase
VATIRPATLDDAQDLAETVRLGFEGYRAWAPRGWDPPPTQLHLIRLRETLGQPGAWCEIAFDGESVAAHAAFSPARTRAEPREPIQGVAHLWMLFVREPWWGTGLAAELLGRATTEAAARGFATMWLDTPSAHGRARAFYEREGWSAAGEATYDPALGLELVEYRRTLA